MKPSRVRLTPENLAKLLHAKFEELAPKIDRRWVPTGSRFWDELPTIPRKALIEICAAVIDELDLD